MEALRQPTLDICTRLTLVGFRVKISRQPVVLAVVVGRSPSLSRHTAEFVCSSGEIQKNIPVFALLQMPGPPIRVSWSRPHDIQPGPKYSQLPSVGLHAFRTPPPCPSPSPSTKPLSAAYSLRSTATAIASTPVCLCMPCSCCTVAHSPQTAWYLSRNRSSKATMAQVPTGKGT